MEKVKNIWSSFFPKKKKDSFNPRNSSLSSLSTAESSNSSSTGDAGKAIFKSSSTPNLLYSSKRTFENAFALGKKIGEGSFAVVFHATRKLDYHPFAVKIIDKKNIKSLLENSKVALEAEIDILKRVKHDHIISLVDFFDSREKVYLVTDLATGGELFDQIVEKGSFTEKDAAAIISQVLKAIDYLHDLNIVHRDLKPENLLLRDTKSSHILVSDFGLARESSSDVFLQTSIGTPGYIAPEVIKRTGHGRPVDLWAVGVITYVLLSGFTPFYGDTDTELLEAICHCRYEFEDIYWKNISSEAKDFIQSLLVLNPETRFTAKQALDHVWLKTEKGEDISGVLRRLSTRKTQKKNSIKSSMSKIEE